jgi:hypothetical protein
VATEEGNVKLTKFEAETNVNGVMVKVTREGAVLSFEGVRAEDVVPLIQHLEKFKNAATATKVAPKPRAPKTAPPEPAVEANGAANGKVHHLPTPAELQAKKEKVAGAVRAAADELATKADDIAEETVSGKSAEPFVEDLDVHKAVDQGKRVADGKEEVPKELAGAKNLKEVLLYFHENSKLRSNDEMVETCIAWREKVPVLSRIDLKALKLRVTTTTDTLGLWQD